jgi:hypothetical protein
VLGKHVPLSEVLAAPGAAGYANGDPRLAKWRGKALPEPALPEPALEPAAEAGKAGGGARPSGGDHQGVDHRGVDHRGVRPSERDHYNAAETAKREAAAGRLRASVPASCTVSYSVTPPPPSAKTYKPTTAFSLRCKCGRVFRGRSTKVPADAESLGQIRAGVQHANGCGALSRDYGCAQDNARRLRAVAALLPPSWSVAPADPSTARTSLHPPLLCDCSCQLPPFPLPAGASAPTPDMLAHAPLCAGVKPPPPTSPPPVNFAISKDKHLRAADPWEHGGRPEAMSFPRELEERRGQFPGTWAVKQVVRAARGASAPNAGGRRARRAGRRDRRAPRRAPSPRA